MRDSYLLPNDQALRSAAPGDELNDALAVLRSSHVFSPLSEPELHAVARSLRFRRFKRGAILFYEDEPWPGVYIIRSGKIKTLRASPHGKLQIVSIIGPGELMGVASVLDVKASRVTAQAVFDSEVYVLPPEHFKQLLLQHAEVSFEVIRVMSARLERVYHLLNNMSFERVPQRIARFFLTLAHEHGTPVDDGICLDVLLSRKELAEAVGTSEETTVRVMTRLKKAGIICLRDRRIVIVEPAKLKEWAQW